jgi:hypothetical protein
LARNPPSIESVQRMAVFILKLGEQGSELLAYYGDVNSARDAWINHYHGEHDNELEFAIQLFDRLYMAAIPEAAQLILIMHFLDVTFLSVITFHWRLRGNSMSSLVNYIPRA